MLEPLLTTVGVVLLLGGCTFATIGLIGLIIKPDLFEQLHVAGLLTGPGVILVLLASVATGSAHTVTSAVLVVGFVLLTSSISTHVIAQAGARRYAEAVADAGANAGATADAGAATGFTAGSSATSTDPLLAGGAASVPRLLTAGMKVLVAHDASSAAQLASQLVAAIDWPAGSMLRLVRAESDEIGSAPSPAADLDEAARLMEGPGLEVQTAILRGEAADTIVDDALAFGADVLVIGARRRGLVRSVLGGSASGEILDRASCPVLVARSTSLRSVLLATDGSTESGLATDVVARWPIFDLARIHVVSVATDSRPGREGPQRAWSRSAAEQRTVDAAAARLMDAGRDVVTEVLEGRPGAQLVEAARRRSVDLVVIGSRGRTGLGRALLGSVAGEVLASARCSVLVVKPPLRRPPGTRVSRQVRPGAGADGPP